MKKHGPYMRGLFCSTSCFVGFFVGFLAGRSYDWPTPALSMVVLGAIAIGLLIALIGWWVGSADSNTT